MAKIDISNLDKAELLAALYNNASPLGMGMLHFDPNQMTKEDAETIIMEGDDLAHMFPGASRRNYYFDYVKGRPLKIDISGDTMETALYDRDQGTGAGARVVAELRNKK